MKKKGLKIENNFGSCFETKKKLFSLCFPPKNLDIKIMHQNVLGILVDRSDKKTKRTKKTCQSLFRRDVHFQKVNVQLMVHNSKKHISLLHQTTGARPSVHSVKLVFFSSLSPSLGAQNPILYWYFVCLCAWRPVECAGELFHLCEHH